MSYKVFKPPIGGLSILVPCYQSVLFATNLAEPPIHGRACILSPMCLKQFCTRLVLDTSGFRGTLLLMACLFLQGWRPYHQQDERPQQLQPFLLHQLVQHGSLQQGGLVWGASGNCRTTVIQSLLASSMQCPASRFCSQPDDRNPLPLPLLPQKLPVLLFSPLLASRQLAAGFIQSAPGASEAGHVSERPKDMEATQEIRPGHYSRGSASS